MKSPIYIRRIRIFKIRKIIIRVKPDKINLTKFPNNNEQEKIKVIIDTDIGDIGTDWDDSLSIIYALNIPNLKILGLRFKSISN